VSRIPNKAIISALRMGAAKPSLTVDTMSRMVAFLDNAVHPDCLTPGIGPEERETARGVLDLICKAYREAEQFRADRRKAVRA
jgi:hypothetical protein